MSPAGAKLIKTLRQILCVFNALLTISVVIQVVDFITKLALKSKKVPKKALKKLQGQLIANSWQGTTENANLSLVSLGFLGGDIIILSVTVIIGWIGIITFKRRILYVYSVLMVVDVLYTIVLIIRDASSDSWLIMCDAVINISICIVMYFLFKELSKCNFYTHNIGNNIGNNNLNSTLHRINSSLNGYPSGSILPTAASAASALGSILDADDMADGPDAPLESYLNTRRATIWSNGSLLCEAPPSTYWDAPLCISVAPSPFTINCDPPPPWSPSEDSSINESLALNNISSDNNNNDRINHNSHNVNVIANANATNGQIVVVESESNDRHHNQDNSQPTNINQPQEQVIFNEPPSTNQLNGNNSAIASEDTVDSGAQTNAQTVSSDLIIIQS